MGLPTDQEAADILHKEWKGKADAAEKALRGLYEVKQYELQMHQEFNLGSTKQLGVLLTKFGGLHLPKTPSGNPKTDEATLNSLREKVQS